MCQPYATSEHKMQQNTSKTGRGNHKLGSTLALDSLHASSHASAGAAACNLLQHCKLRASSRGEKYTKVERSSCTFYLLLD